MIHVSNSKIFYFLHRTLRYVPESSQDKIIADEDVFETLLKTFKALFVNDLSRQADILALLPEVKCQYLELLTVEQKQSKVNSCNHQGQQHVFTPEEVLFNTLGFTVSRDQSSLVSAGTGVFVTKGFVPKGTVVSMYPGNGYSYFWFKWDFEPSDREMPSAYTNFYFMGFLSVIPQQNHQLGCLRIFINYLELLWKYKRQYWEG